MLPEPFYEVRRAPGSCGEFGTPSTIDPAWMDDPTKAILKFTVLDVNTTM